METLPTSSELCISSASSITRCSSYIFKKAPGYVIVLEPFRGSWRAIVHDERFPGLSRSYVTSVLFEKGFKLQEFIARNAFWQSRHIHLIDKIVFFGALGLKGGGFWNATVGRCDNFWCWSVPFKCACGFQSRFCKPDCSDFPFHECPKCWHQCLRNRICHNCRSRRVCAKCCQCYIKQTQAAMQKEKERQEQIRQQQERERQEQERQAVLSKLDASLATVKIAQDHQIVSTDHSNIVSESDQENVYAFVSVVTAPERVTDSDSGWETQQDQLTNAPIFFETTLAEELTTCDIVSNNRRGVDSLFHKAKTFLQNAFHYSSRSESLLIELLSYYGDDQISLNNFRARWFVITEHFSNSEQVILLKSLRDKRNLQNLSLFTIGSVLDFILLTGTSGFSIVSGNDENWLIDLKRTWLESKVDTLTNEELFSYLASMDWGKGMFDLFIKAVQDEVNFEPILELLKTIKIHGVPDSKVMPIIDSETFKSENCKVVLWTQAITCRYLLQELNEVPREVISVIEQLINKLTRSSCSVHMVIKVLTENLSLIKAHSADFANVLSMLIDYQVTENICIAVFSLLSKETAANWMKKCDKLITKMLFQIPEVYATDELIQLIADKSSFEPIWLRNNYDAVLESYKSTSNLSNDGFTKKHLSNWNKEDVLLWAKSVKSSTYSLPELIAGVKHAAELLYRNVYSNFAIRDTQLFALLTLLNPSEGMGRLVQINTGEGKSLIVAMLAAVHALQGKKVDVITTSTELSIPEVKKQTLFFESLSLTVAENSNSETKKKAYECDVLYGTSSDFQADILQTEFLGNDIRSNRGFSIVIVDEVDSMLFDNRSHSVRLSGQAPGMTHLELPLAAIWEHMLTTVKHLTTVKDQTFFIPDDFERVGEEITLYSGQDWKSCAVLVDDKRSFIMKHTQNHLQQLLRELNEEEKKEYEAFKELNNEMRSLEEEVSKITNAKTKKNKQKQCELLIQRLKNLPWSQRYPVLDIPVHLHDFARSQVPFWIKNAINAAYGFKVGKHYTIQHNRIVPVHYNETGVLQSNMVWTDGLTQFLQLKEGLAMDPEGVATNFISNVSFFKRYNASIFGVTGTLGEQSTKDFMHKMYNIDTAVIPPYQHRTIADNSLSTYLCKELVPIIHNTKELWFETILEKVLYHTQHKRAVLVICKFIVQVENLAKELYNRYDANKIFIYTGEGSKFDKTKIESGEIVLATNIAGRGKDLETSESVEEHGGLYVAVTFLPESYRVEMQNVGRTARSGRKGMAQLIIFDPLGLDIRSKKDDRDTQEHLATKKAMDDAQNTLLQDYLFREFCGFEMKHLPAVSAIWLGTKWTDLSKAWERHSSKVLSPKEVEKYVNHRVEEREQGLIEQSLASLSDSDQKKISEADKQMFREKAVSQAESERTYFEKEYKNKVLHDFCDAQLHVPEELLVSLKEGRKFQLKCSKLAQKYDWGLHDRKGFEEAWGFWLKAKHFEENVKSKEEALKLFHDEFASTYDKRAEEDKLVSNPYFYVLKGNTYLDRDDLQSAITCYDRAICMDPAFSVNARYCKAQALLSYEENRGYRQKLAVDELKKAKEIIGTISRPALLTFSALIAQHGTKIETSNHVQYQLNLLSQQENYIDNALDAIEEALSSNFHVKLSKRPLLETLNASDRFSHKKAAREAAVNGFTGLFTVQLVKPVPWFDILGLALIAVAQIAAGCLILAYTGGTLGSSLISEGISDMITAVKAAYEGSFDWAAWAVEKAISLAVSLICCGLKGLKNACSAVANTAKAVKLGKAGVTVTKQGVKLATRTVTSALAKGVAKECLDLSVQWCFKWIYDELEQAIRERVEKTINEALLNNPLVVKALESDVKNKNNYWQQCFINEGLSLMREETEHVCISMLRKICLGVAEKKISATPVLKLNGVYIMFLELDNYTNDFICKFNSKVMTYKSDIESIVEQNPSNNTESTLALETISSAPDVNPEDTDILIDSERENNVYTSKTESASDGIQSFYNAGGPSHMGSIADVFKGKIASNLLDAISDIVGGDRSIDSGIDTNAIFKQSENVTDDLRKELWLARRRSHSNKFSHSEQKRNKKDQKSNKNVQKKIGNTHNEEQSKEKRDDSELNKSSLKEVEKLKGDVPLDSNDLALLASAVGSPIYVYESGKLVDVVGENLPGKRVTLQHEKKDGSGHWEPLNSDVNVKSSGTNNCLIDSVFEQLEPDKKRKLQNATKVKEKMTEIIYNNPKEANRAYEIRERLEKIAPDTLLIGGRKP